MFAHVLAGEHLSNCDARSRWRRSTSPRVEEIRTIGALFTWSVKRRALALSARLAFEEGIGQVVKGDGGVQVEQPHRPVNIHWMHCDGLSTVCHQCIGGAIQAASVRHRCRSPTPSSSPRALRSPMPAPGGAARSSGRAMRAIIEASMAAASAN